MAKRRYLGVDALRLLAMFFVVLLHVLGQGGVLAATGLLGLKWGYAWLLECLAYGAVDIYALVSGFVGYRQDGRPVKYARFIELWLQVLFYSALFAGIFAVAMPQVIDKWGIIHALMPVTGAGYWYFTAYAGVFLVSPLLNRLVRQAGERTLAKASILFLGLFGAWSAVAFRLDPFVMKGGYSFVWLAMLWVVGACLRKYGVHERVSSRAALVLVLACTLVTWLWKVGTTAYTTSAFGEASWWCDIPVSYLSPTVSLAAVGLVFLGARWEVGGPRLAKAIEFLAPASFGVYLIQTNPYVFVYVMTDAFAFLAGLPGWAFLLAVPAAAFAVFAACLIIDRVRLSLFGLMHGRALCEAAERLARRLAGTLVDKTVERLAGDGTR